MSAARPLLFAVLAAALWAPAPAAQASELVKLAKLIVTGKRSPTVPLETKPLPATSPVVPVQSRSEAAGPAPAPVNERNGQFEPQEGQDGSAPAQRLELPRPERGAGDRVGAHPNRPQVG
ncbi:MAG: hypothetical protein U1E77_10370 [Inhella sp.]